MSYGYFRGEKTGVFCFLLLFVSSCKHDEYHVLKKDVEKKALTLGVQSQVPEVMPDVPPATSTASAFPIAQIKPQADARRSKTVSTFSKNPVDVLSPGGKLGLLDPAQLDFIVENKTGKTVYVSCFSWLRKNAIGYWRWNKSPVYRIDNNASVVIDVAPVKDKQDREVVFGYLAVHTDYQEAEDATFELLDDHKKLDLDMLIKLQGKKVTLDIEHYGFKGDFFEYDFLPRNDNSKNIVPELDFIVENRTGKTVFVTCFVYEKKAKGSWVAATEAKDDMAQWRWDKAPIIKLAPRSLGLIDVDTIVSKRDRSYVRGYLAVFDEDEEAQAQEATFELLQEYRKLNLGDLNQFTGKKVVVEIEKYGIEEDFLEYVVKPVNKIDFSKLYK